MTENNDKRLYWLWLLHALKGKSYKMTKIFKQFNDINEIYRADFDRLMSVDSIDEDDKLALCNKELTDADKTLRFCTAKGVTVITYDCELYPAELKEISSFPCILFAYGNVQAAFSKPKIAIVGTRDSTSYGEMCTKNLSYALSKAGFTIVTGVAAGIDTAAITGAMSAGGSVISVIPGGLSRSHFSSTYSFKNILEKGVILSEHLPNRPTYKFSYHERNRLISGLSVGTIVTQAPVSSGALITANHALDQNRDVFALIANTDMEQSKGSNNLLRDGAYPLIDYHDVIDFYRLKLGDALNTDLAFDPAEVYEPPKDEKDEKLILADFKRIAEQHLSFEETVVFDCIGLVETDIDAIIEKTGYPVSTVMSILSSLENSGAITSCPGNKYKITLRG